MTSYRRILFVLFFPIALFSQNEIIGNFNSCHSGRSIDLIYNYQFKNDFKLGLGVLFNVNNRSMPDNQGNIYKKRLHAENFSQRFGLQIFCVQPIFRKFKNFEMDFFYNLQVKRAPTFNHFYTLYLDPEVNPFMLLIESELSKGTMVWLQNTFGIGIQIQLWKQFYLNQKLGFGIELMHQNFPENYVQPKKWDWAFAKQFNVGIVYKLNK